MTDERTMTNILKPLFPPLQSNISQRTMTDERTMTNTAKPTFPPLQSNISQRTMTDKRTMTDTAKPLFPRCSRTSARRRLHATGESWSSTPEARRWSAPLLHPAVTPTCVWRMLLTGSNSSSRYGYSDTLTTIINH